MNSPHFRSDVKLCIQKSTNATLEKTGSAAIMAGQIATKNAWLARRSFKHSWLGHPGGRKKDLLSQLLGIKLNCKACLAFVQTGHYKEALFTFSLAST